MNEISVEIHTRSLKSAWGRKTNHCFEEPHKNSICCIRLSKRKRCRRTVMERSSEMPESERLDTWLAVAKMWSPPMTRFHKPANLDETILFTDQSCKNRLNQSQISSKSINNPSKIGHIKPFWFTDPPIRLGRFRSNNAQLSDQSS